MTLIVASAVGSTPDELYDAARKAALHADWIEIRLDTPTGLPWDLRSYFSFPKPCIATVRHALDGGRSEADDKTRADILRRAVQAGARGIDVEAWSDEAPALLREARAHGVMSIVSRHLDHTPTTDALVGMLRAARELGADHAKLAVHIESTEDAVHLVTAARRARNDRLSFALMAVNDPVLRLFAPDCGMSLVYASIPGIAPAAPGQIPADILREAFKESAAGSARRVTGATRPVLLLGHPVDHSKSPAMQNAAFAASGIDAQYVALDVPAASLAATLDTMKTTNALGCNVTIPHKEATVPLMDELAESAKQAGAVNLIVFREGRAIGHNTDGAGALAALREGGVKLPGARTLIMGAGGAGRAVTHALKAAGADVTITNRTAARAVALGIPTIPWDRIPDVMRNVDLLVNATSLGLHGEPVPAPVQKMLPGAAVLDCVYGDTPLIKDAREHGLLAIRGDGMLVHQGALSFEHWTGKPAPVGIMRSALESA